MSSRYPLQQRQKNKSNQGMVARLLKFLIFLQIALVIALLTFALKVLHIKQPAWALLLSMGLVLLCRLLITAHNFYQASRYRSEIPSTCELGWHQKFQLLMREFSASIRTSSWTMLHYPFSRRLVEHPLGYPVLLIHGYGCNSGYWNDISKIFTKKYISHHAIDLEPIFGDINDYVPLVHRAIETLCQESSSDKIIIVAHSMGGLVARAYLRDHGMQRVVKVITLATPHHGTALASYGIGANCRQMHTKHGESSQWLRQLAATESKAVRAMFTSIYSYHDNIVSPQLSCVLPGAKNIAFHGIGHVSMALNPAIQACLIDEIQCSNSVAAESSH
jgi:triacylglycerol lipase